MFVLQTFHVHMCVYVWGLHSLYICMLVCANIDFVNMTGGTTSRPLCMCTKCECVCVNLLRAYYLPLLLSSSVYIPLPVALSVRTNVSTSKWQRCSGCIVQTTYGAIQILACDLRRIGSICVVALQHFYLYTPVVSDMERNRIITLNSYQFQAF